MPVPAQLELRSAAKSLKLPPRAQVAAPMRPTHRAVGEAGGWVGAGEGAGGGEGRFWQEIRACSRAGGAARSAGTWRRRAALTELPPPGNPPPTITNQPQQWLGWEKVLAQMRG
jgi:hypothetical protein